MPATTRLAQIIAHQEGFGIPGTIPTVRHNPGDLRHSPHSSHVGIGPDDIGIIATDDLGWQDLERQLRLYAQRGMTLEEMAATYAPAADGNNTVAYLAGICSGLGMTPNESVLSALTIPAKAITS